jgi:tRNA threonylcarbamoyladenosine biosynthesis protein TsaE
MGSGKTTLVKEILHQKGITDVSSPTFSIVNRYDTEEGPYFHFDLYRIEVLEELYDIGIEEYLDSGNPCLIEWPELLNEVVDLPLLHVAIEHNDGFRTFKITRPEVR